MRPTTAQQQQHPGKEAAALSDLDLLVLQCVDRGLSRCGKSAAMMLYWHLQNRRGIRKEEIPAKPEVFEQALRDMFGESSRALEYWIIRELRAGFSGALSGKSLSSLSGTICELRSKAPAGEKNPPCFFL
jgi:hypothetical protein